MVQINEQVVTYFSFLSFIEQVRKNGGRVFVHCHAGISRSATVCIAYMMKTRSMSVEEAYRFIKSKRPIISPNLHFMGQLLEYQMVFDVDGVLLVDVEEGLVLSVAFPCQRTDL